MVEEIKNHSKPILLILVVSSLFFIFWVLARRIIEPIIFGGYIVIWLVLLGIIFACLWHFINSFWIKQNNARRYILVGSIIVILTSVYYSQVVSLNNTGGGGMYMYPMLADAFAHGQLHLMPLPSPELLALPDPYDPVGNRDHNIHDAALFDGKYYVYFGPVPAVLLMMVNELFHAGAGNNFLMDFFLSLCALMFLVIIFQIWQRNYQEVSWRVALLCFVTLAWSFPVMWVAGRPSVYETAITGGQAFLLTGLYFLLLAFDQSKMRNLLLAGSGITLGLAVGARWNLAVAVILLAILVLVLLVGPLSQKKLALGPLLAFLMPMVLLAIVYGYYNFARFGSPFEFGTQYVLGGYNMRKLSTFSLANIKNNLIRYSVIPPTDFRFQYPFITFADVNDRAVYNIYGVTPHPQIGDNGFEMLAAVFWLAPLTLAGLYAIFSLIKNFPGFRRSEVTQLTFIEWLGHKDQLHSSFLTLAAFGGFVPILFFVGSTMRYHMDYFPALGLLATIGILKLFTLKSGDLYCVFIKSFLLFLALYTVLLGMIASITSYRNTFAITAPGIVNALNIFMGVFQR